MMQIGTRQLFQFEHDEFRKTVRNFFSNYKEEHKEWEKLGFVPKRIWKEAGDLGLLGLQVPDVYGGLETNDFLYSTIVHEEQSYSNCSGYGFSLHSDIVMPYILDYGSENQKQEYLPPLVSGEKVAAIAMTEPGAGSDLQGIKTTAVYDEAKGNYRLNGSKTYITNGFNSDVVIVVAKTNPSAKSAAHGISLFLVEDGMKGFSKGNMLNKIGMKAQDTCELFFDDVELNEKHLLGEKDKGFYYLLSQLPQERLLIANLSLSSAEFCFETTRQWLKDRKAFNTTLSNFQSIRHQMAKMKMEICSGRSFLDNALYLHNHNKCDTYLASLVKTKSTELQNDIANECLQLHGGIGFMYESEIGKAFVDARVTKIYGGSNEIMLELAARQIFN